MSSESKKHTGKQHFVVVHNAQAGRKKDKIRSRIENFFSKRGLSYEFADLESCSWDDISKKVIEYEEVRFIAAGGDGTLRAVFQKLWEHNLLASAPVAFLPLGSANITALSFKLPFGMTRALRKAIHGTPKQVDLGLVNEKHVFFIMVSFGTASRVVVETKRNMKKRFGALAYVLSLPSLLAHTYEAEKFNLSGTAHKKGEMHSMIVCNHLNIAGLTPARGLTPDDGNLHTITLHNKTPWGFFKGAYDFYLTVRNSNVLQHKRIQKEVYTFENFTGEVHIDGDTFTDVGDTVEFSVLPGAAKLVT